MKTIAVLGASNNRSKYGNKCVRAYRAAGYEVYPIHRSEAEIEGLKTYPTLADAPKPLERISVYLPPPVTLDYLQEIAEAGAEQVWFNPGAADPAVLAEADRLGIASIPGCSIVDIGYSPSQFPG
jgi:predicted CoA-binding protein